MKLEKEKLESMTNELVEWIRTMMKDSGGSKAIVGISGGKDSSVVASLCVKAIGKENVFGVLMPDGIQRDIDYAHEICSYLDISHEVVPIHPMTDAFLTTLESIKGDFIPEISNQTRINLPPRVRMTLLYALSQSIEGSRVINTSNLSEDWVGYATIYGDTAGAFSPLAMLTTDEVIQVGRYLGVPEKFLAKPPEDGLTGKTDEDVLGFSYDTLNRYIREGNIENEATKKIIDKMHKNSRFKFVPIPMFKANLPIKAEDIADIYNEEKE
ncbi:NAD(+) synthase [Clostridium sp. D2Q-11]|uniref:NH(3)-dependent NAD(+) synthetase n=1 Tax=Anaeromonas frigoriresistens TaxID=2683708 RepID=A0A942UXK6_9FIRM|nr:NAD(+) synthase [Anaeromonas frigoriresistens]MBS4538811.1 NAD(+) synthase [Anaeromonas frigoriresistens]